MSFNIVSIFSPYSIESSSSKTNSGVTLKLILWAILLLINPEEDFKPAKVYLTFLEFNMLTLTFAYLKSGEIFTEVTLTIPVTFEFVTS